VFSRPDHRNRHEAAHSYSLTCGVCGQYFNRLDNLARHRAQHERPEAKQTTDEEISSTWSRTQPKAATYRVTTNKYPPRKEPSCSRYGGSTWRPRDPCPIFKTLEYHSDRGSDRYNFTLHEMTASTFTEMVHQIFREQTTAFKINVSFGFSLRHMETGELRYYHSSQNNSRLLMFHTSSEQKKTWRNF
jgi:hypothetical protein